MKNQFWACLGSQPIHEKKVGANYEQLLRAFFFMFSRDFFFENITASALKSCIEKMVKKNHVFVFFYKLKFKCNLSIKVGKKHLSPHLW